MSYSTILLLSPAVVLGVWLLYAQSSLFLRYKHFADQHGCLPAPNANRLDPLLGLDHFFRLAKADGERRYLEHWHKSMFGRYGNTFSINLMGQCLLFTNEPLNIQTVLVTKFPDFDVGQRRRDNSADLLGVGVFNADGDIWTHARAAVRPNLTRQQVSNFDLFEKHFLVWRNAIPGNGELVDMQEWAFRYTLEVGTEFLFDKCPGVLRPEGTELGQKFAWAFEVAVSGISTRTRLGILAPLWFSSDYKKACNAVHEYVNPIVQAAVERAQSKKEKPFVENPEVERYTFIDALASEGMAPKKIRDQLLNILLAARDTSACLMSSAFFQIARNAEVQAKLRAEIQDRLQGRLPKYDDLKNMTYLNWFIKEVLRLHPSIPINVRVANKDTYLPTGGGPDGKAPLFVPKGQEVVYEIYSTHHRQDLWGNDADEFRPERWETIRPHFQYLPFNAGPRICPGQQFALMETSYVIVRFLQEYSGLEGPIGDARPWAENLTLTCSVGQGSWAKLTRRAISQG